MNSHCGGGGGGGGDSIERALIGYNIATAVAHFSHALCACVGVAQMIVTERCNSRGYSLGGDEPRMREILAIRIVQSAAWPLIASFLRGRMI